MGKGAEGQDRQPSPSASCIAAVTSDSDFASDPQVWDLVVVGAGVAGCALAYAQAKEGRRVLLLERDFTQPDRIVGELLQPGGYLKLKQLGLADCCEHIDSQKVHGYCIFKDGRQAKVAYPTDNLPSDIAGRSFHNGRFVQRLRQAAAAQPSITVRQGTAVMLLNGNGEQWREDEAVAGVRYKSTDANIHDACAALTLVCDGMYSSLRAKLSVPNIQHPSYFVGLVLRGCALPWPNYGHVILARPSPILFYPISSTEVRCLVDIPGEKLPAGEGALAQHLRESVAPQIPPQLHAAFLEAVDTGRVRSMRNKSMPAAPLHRPGALLLGDAFNMRHPLTGGGMTVALSDAALLCDMLRPLPDFSDPLATSSATAAFYTRRKPLSATINTLANALYQVFCYKGSTAHTQMQSACFDYLALGGWYSAGPVSLLSGLNPRPSVLVMHFFAVAVYGVCRLMTPRPTLRGLHMGILLLWCAACIILPIIHAEGLRAVFAPFLTRHPKPNAVDWPSSKASRQINRTSWNSHSGGSTSARQAEEPLCSSCSTSERLSPSATSAASGPISIAQMHKHH